MDTRGAAENLLPALCNFTFVCYIFFWNQILKEVDCTQKGLQTKGLSLDKLIAKVENLRLYLQQNRSGIVEDSIKEGIKLAEEHDICTERRARRKKLMPGETSKDSCLTMKEEIQKDMFECLDRFYSELTSRTTSSYDVASLFEVVQPSLLLMGEESDVKKAVKKLTEFYEEISESELLLEVFRFRRHLQASKLDSSQWMSMQIFEFIVEWDFIDSVPNLFLALKLFLTVCTSVASCERSFSKLKLIKNFLRSTMGADRLNSLAILSIEHAEAEKINFDDALSDFAEKKARKAKL